MALYAFDGTWNSEKDAGEYDRNTNVVRFKDLYTGPSTSIKVSAPSTDSSASLPAGHSASVATKESRTRSGTWRSSSPTGTATSTSSGSVAARRSAVHFANVIADDGVSVNGVLEQPPVRFLGVWDVVAAFGIPINLGFNFNRINLGYKLGLSKGVKFCYHALALDEARQAFRPTRVRGGCEVWFRGVHSDVGGGNDNHALNDITLRWMLRKAIASGLPMVADCVGTSLHARQHRRQDRRQLRSHPAIARASPRPTTGFTTRWRCARST